MKIFVSCVAVIFSIAACFSLSYAEGANCDGNKPCQQHAVGNGGLFNRLDTNGDGSISKAEFDAFNAEHFKNLDTNKDGKISPDELRAVQNQFPPNHEMGHGDGTTHLDQRFYAADINHDGGLDRNEAINMPMLSKYFDDVDTNKDGKVTRQEYFEAMPLLHGVKKIDTSAKPQSM
jgi:Ca2+-binding EF-hand superfamily protein